MIIRPQDREKSFKQLRNGGLAKKGLSTGFVDLDEHIKLAKGYMAIISGYPGCGKSEALDAILVNMSLLHEWKVLYYSPENHPVEQHMSKISEKFIGKHITEFSNVDFDDALHYMSKYFTWMYPDSPKLDTLLNLATEHAETNGLDCLVIDPWNAVSHNHSGQMIHEYLSEALSKVIKFARDKNVLSAIIAHPTKPLREKDGSFPVPDLYSISDGAHWRNKCDLGIIFHRPDMSKNEIQMYIQKIKYKWMGKLGMVELDYNWRNGRFKGKNDKEFLLPTETEAAF